MPSTQQGPESWAAAIGSRRRGRVRRHPVSLGGFPIGCCPAAASSDCVTAGRGGHSFFCEVMVALVVARLVARMSRVFQVMVSLAPEATI